MNKSGKTLIFIFYPYYLCIFSISAAVLTCKMCTNRHLSFVFGQNHIRGAAIKDERFVRKKKWRFGELATVAHMGVLEARVAIIG